MNRFFKIFLLLLVAETSVFGADTIISAVKSGSNPLLSIVGKKIFPVDDFGARADDGQNDRDAIMKAVSAAMIAGPDSIVTFSSGKYIIDLSDAEKLEKPIETTTPSQKRGLILISLIGARGVSLQGNNTQFIVKEPRAVLFDFSSSKNCSLRGFKIDYDPLPFLQGEIIAVDKSAKTFDIEIPDGYPLLGVYPWLTFGGEMDWSNRLLIFGEGDQSNEDRGRRGEKHLLYEFRPATEMYLKNLSFKALSGRKFRISSTVVLDDDVTKGNTLVYTSKVGGEPLLRAGYDTNEKPDGAQNLTIEDVAIYASPGFVIGGTDANNLWINRFEIRRKPGTDRLVAGTSDGIHVRATRGGPRIENCYLESTFDDMVNLSANPVPIVSVINEQELLVHGYRGSIKEGDTIFVYSMPDATVKGVATILHLSHNGTSSQPRTMVLDNPIPGITEADYLYSWNSCNPGAVYRNNTFKSGLRSALMVMAADGLTIEGNRFEQMPRSVNIQQAESSSRSGQGGLVRNVVIRSNEFYACHGTDSVHRSHPDHVIGVMLYPNSTSKALRNVRIEGNTIYEPGLYGIWLSNVSDALVSNNTVIAYSDSRTLLDGYNNRKTVRIHNSSNIVVNGVYGDEPRSDLKAVIVTDPLSSNIQLLNIEEHHRYGQKHLIINNLEN